MEHNGTNRMQELVDLLNSYIEAYYTTDSPVISDAEYDVLYDELTILEKMSGIVLDNSPTRRVGATPSTEFLPHTHISRLYSLDKVQSKEELRAWCEKQKGCEFSLEYKFDGLTVNLTYDGGKLVCGATRGNGVTGELILPQIMTIRSIPLTIPFMGKVEIQGEGYMRLSVLDRLNEGGEQLKNARNAAAGALRNLDPAVTSRRHLDCCCYNVGYIEGREPFSSHAEMMSFLRENKLPTSDYIKYTNSADEIIAAIENIDRDSLDILIDGMVVKVCDMNKRAELGFTERFPKWAIAYKFPAQERETVVEDITWEVGRTGKLTPLAHVTPVNICGATIRRATLNNFDDIQRKRVSVGSKVLLRRSNDVIPEIIGSIDDSASTVKMPTECPACHAHVEQRGVHIFCTNSLSCKPQAVARLSHFASRNAMDIDGFSERTAELLVEKKIVSTIPELYTLTVESFSELEGFGSSNKKNSEMKKANSIIAAIEKSKSCTLSAFLYAIGIPNVGEKTAKDIAKHFCTLDAVMAATAEELVTIPDVGDTIAMSIVDFFADTEIRNDILRLIELGITPAAVVHDDNGVLFGKTLVVTGKLIKSTRNEIEALIEKHGGKASSSVSRNTDMVVVGEDAGSKLDKARSLGVRTISEDELYKIIGEEK